MILSVAEIRIPIRILHSKVLWPLHINRPDTSVLRRPGKSIPVSPLEKDSWHCGATFDPWAIDVQT